MHQTFSLISFLFKIVINNDQRCAEDDDKETEDDNEEMEDIRYGGGTQEKAKLLEKSKDEKKKD